MGYCTIEDVYRTAGITLTVVSEPDIRKFIKSAEIEVDRITFSTHWNVEDYGTATAGASSTLTDTGKSWQTNEFAGQSLWIYGGTGNGQIRKILSNTATVLTVSAAWDTNPSTDSTYRIIYTASDPYVSEELRDGDESKTLFLENYPLVLLESVSIDSTDVTTSTVYTYKDMGKIVLSSDSEKTYWASTKPQLNDLAYWFGVYPINQDAKRLTELKAAIMALRKQEGSTYDTPSTYSAPEGSFTVGQAYINIETAINSLSKEEAEVIARIPKYPAID